MKIFERNLQEIGKSLLVTLPKSWTSPLKLKKGSKVKIIVSKAGDLVIAPEVRIDEHERKAVIVHDNNLPRHFFREYFKGAEEITIIYKNVLDENEKKRMYSFLKKFMNVQIIDEGQAKIAVRVFRVDELSIQDCLKRMHFLSLNMIDEVLGANDALKMKEIEESLTRFYYMLVMQTRRFLEEGKFTEQNQIPLIRSMDFRMAAEKIERIADALVKAGDIRAVKLEGIVGAFKKYYSDVFQCFINEKYQQSVDLWAEQNKLREKILGRLSGAEKNKDIPEYRQAMIAVDLLNCAKDISLLIR